MAYEDIDVAKIRGFVTKCLESIGALVEFPEYNYAEVLLPDDFAWYFDGKSYFTLSFDFDVAKQHEDSEFVTYGSHFFDRVIDLATERGLTCKRHILDEKLEPRNLPQKIGRKVSFGNCRTTFVAGAPVLYHYALFSFKVSYISDERVDRVAKILINLNTGHVDDRMLKAVNSAIFTDSSHANYTVEEMQSIDSAYQAATLALEERIQPMLHELNGKIRSRLNSEKKRISEYYDKVDDELNLKRDRLMLSEYKDGIKSIDDKLRLSEIERQRRLNEIEEKNTLKVSVLLFNVTMISQTKIRNRYDLKHGKAEHEIHIVWNPLLNDIDIPVCNVCNSETTRIELCSNSHIGCPECVSVCSICDACLCSDCGMAKCAACGEPVCGKCKIVCENCGDVLCKSHIESCTCKEEKRRKEAEEKEARERKKQEKEEKLRQERIRELSNILLWPSEPIEQYLNKYVRENVGELDQKWEDLMHKASRIVGKNDKIKLRPILQELNSKYPPNAWVMSNLVLSYKRLDQKLASLGTQAVHLASHLALAHMALGYTHERNGDFDAAIKSYEQAAYLAGDSERDIAANVIYQIGEIFYERRDWWEAERRWEHALSVDPNFTPARQALDRFYR